MATGVGSCASAGITNSTHYYCSSGANCNNMDGKSCWNPVNGAAASTTCSSSDWQCKTDIETGVGSCTGAGTTDSTTYYCGSGPDCNNPSVNTCWNPINGAQVSGYCSSSQWQCKVN